MKVKEVFITIFLTILSCFLFVSNYIANKFVLGAENIYQVYLDGDVVGYLKNDKEFYNIINTKQSEIKSMYGVDEVYPPENLRLINTNSYNVEISSEEDIYEKISNISSFTIEGNIVSIKDEEGNKLKSLNVLHEEDFDEAIKTFVNAFLDEDEYNNYMNGTQPKIETTGRTIETMYFEERITIKKGYMNVSENIYTNAQDLSKVLLYDEDSNLKYYTVKEGDTISSIARDNKINEKEFLVINPSYHSEDSVLTIGDKVNVTLINPIITFSYEVTDVSKIEEKYSKKVEYDYTKPTSYSEITTAGVTGEIINTILYKISNGETQEDAKLLNQEVLVEKVDQVTTKGAKNASGKVIPYVDNGNDWGWPTISKYCITSYYGYRWGRLHEGIDISCSGYGSPIYASMDGTVEAAGLNAINTEGGIVVLLSHKNGLWTFYEHMSGITVKTGDTVTKGTIIGYMGNTGHVVPAPSKYNPTAGTHLHFGIWTGYPWTPGASPMNPLLFL